MQGTLSRHDSSKFPPRILGEDPNGADGVLVYSNKHGNWREHTL